MRMFGYKLISPFQKVATYEQDKSGNHVYMFGTAKYVKDTRTVEGQANTYALCAPVASIVNKKARAFVNAKWWVLDGNKEEVFNAKANLLRDRFINPNPLQSQAEFLTQLYVYLQLFGEVFIFALRPDGFSDPLRTKVMWILPNNAVEVKRTGKVYMQTEVNEIIEDYTLRIGGSSLSLGADNVIHIKDTNQNVFDHFAGTGRLSSLQDQVSNIIAAYEARNVLITRKGAIGLLTNNTKDVAGQIPLKPEEKQELQQDFMKYGLSKEQYQVIITSASLSWQSMTFPTKELMLFEEIEDDVRQIADVFEYPMFLLGFKSGTTFSNVAEAKASLYQDAIIPESEQIAQAFNKFFGTQDLGFGIVPDYTHLEVLQKSAKEQAEAAKLIVEANLPLFEKGLITLNQLLALLDYDTREDGDKYIHELRKTPYAVLLGVSGMQALQAVLSDPTMNDETKRNTLVVIFGLQEEEASRIISTENGTTTQNSASEQGGQSSSEEEQEETN